MISVCITGRMGCGKSYVCGILSAWGHPVYNCDREAKRIMLTDPAVRAGIARLVGPEAYKQPADGPLTLNKPRIAEYLYASRRNTHRLNAIVHPAVCEDAQQWLSRHQDAAFAFIECAIPRQSGIDKIVEHIISITADETIQWKRIRQRDHLSDEEIQARLERQDGTLERTSPHGTPPDNMAGHPRPNCHMILNNGDKPVEPLLLETLAYIKKERLLIPTAGTTHN